MGEKMSAKKSSSEQDADKVLLGELKNRCKAALKRHIICMLGIFVVPCSGAAIVRFGAQVGEPQIIRAIGSFLVIFVIWPSYAYYFIRRLNKPTSQEVEIVDEDDLQICEKDEDDYEGTA
jgi:hypothetical protein